ncbi:MAG: hypothetical protein HZC37_27520 [Burkholderiales bacterium]|nr:hypothetical protein [Burkholderiales bacterium]
MKDTHAGARGLLDTTEKGDLIGLRDRALMTYTFSRVGAVRLMKVGGAYVQGRRMWAPPARQPAGPRAPCANEASDLRFA